MKGEVLAKDFLNPTFEVVKNIRDNLERQAGAPLLQLELDSDGITLDTDALPNTQLDKDLGHISTEERTLATRAIGAVQEFWQRNRRKLSVAASIAALTGGAIAPTASGKEQPKKTSGVLAHTSTSEIPLATNSYPYANDDPAELDEYNLSKRSCESYAVWDLIHLEGVPADRAQALSIEAATAQKEIIDDIPAVGAAVVFSPPNSAGHVGIVKEVSGDMIMVADSNANGDGKISYRPISITELRAFAPDLKFIHFEKPPVANGAFYGASPDELNKNGNIKKLMEVGSYNDTASGEYTIVFSKNGNLAVYKKLEENNYVMKWQSNTAGINVDGISIEKGAKKQGNKLVMWKYKSGDSAAREPVKSWDLGTADRIAVNDDGTLSGYKGKKKVWTASSLPTAPRAAKAAVRKEAVAAKRRALAARKARSAHQAKTTTRVKATHKKVASKKTNRK